MRIVGGLSSPCSVPIEMLLACFAVIILTIAELATVLIPLKSASAVGPLVYPSLTLSADDSLRSGCLADLDGNRDPDLAVTNHWNDNVSVLRNIT